MEWLKLPKKGPYYEYPFEDEIEPTECPPPEELDQATKWAGAFLGATLVTSCALGSICLIPCRHSRFYLMLSNCLVALAISTASGASFFQLAPSALGLSDAEMADNFVILPASVMCLVFWYCLTIDKIKASFKRGYDERNNIVQTNQGHSHEIEEDEKQESCMGQGPCRGLGKVRTVAWVIVVGDGFCNVVDGLTSAASFSVSISKGITVMLAVFMQELPHRIGDYAVLVNAGMTPFQATIFNLLSTATAYLGCLMGLLLLDSGAIEPTYIFGIGTGIFLYVAVGALTPELAEAEEISFHKGLTRTTIFALQNAGIFFGFGIILVFSKFAEQMFGSGDGC